MTFEIDKVRMLDRVAHYGYKAGAGKEMVEHMIRMLRGPVVQRVLEVPLSGLRAQLTNDAYKAKMHKLYSTYMKGVEADFALNVRKTALTLKEMRDVYPNIFKELREDVQQLHQIKPYSQKECDVLRRYFDFEVTPEMMERAESCGVACARWEEVRGQLLALASGPVESVSHVETSTMQLVQYHTIRAQEQALAQQTGYHIDRTERLANSLGKLCAIAERLNALPCSFELSLFAGRRSSDLTYLLLQNLFFAHHVKGYVGTSAILAVTVLDEVMERCGYSPSQRLTLLKGLQGTQAHEMTSLVQQLMVKYDQKAADLSGAPGQGVFVSILLVQLLYHLANSGLPVMTALPDTFTTSAFLKVALAANVPEEFISDIREKYGDVICPESKCFDLVRCWRLDSGSYEEVAGLIVATWENRNSVRTYQGLPPLPRPILMHTNLDSVEEIESLCDLPEHIRPRVLGFGSLADGFIPFDLEDGREVEIKMTSVVMKAVQASAPALGKPLQESAVKLGDDKSLGKVQVDPRLSADVSRGLLERLMELTKMPVIREDAASAVLAEAYHDVTRKGILG